MACTGNNLVQVIDRTECIGNSLSKINSNFKSLDIGVCELDQFNANLLGNDGILLCRDQVISTAQPGVDYLEGTLGIEGLLKSTASDGSITAAISGVDYYIPNTTLFAFNTFVNGTLSASGSCFFNAVQTKTITNEDLSSTGTITAKNINASGNVAITGSVAGGTINSTGAITAGGNITCSGIIRATGDIIAFASSDERLKNKVSNISNALDKVSNINGVQYEWNTELQDIYEGKDVGVIAQEIEKVLPTAVIERDNGYKAVQYEKIIPLLIEAIKELKNEIDYLKSK